MWCLLTASVSATNLPPATVSFLDGSFLRGEIEFLNSETLKWRHPNARQPIEFTTTNLNLIRLPTRSPSLPTNAAPVCRVVLASGDEFEGQLLSLDGDSFEIETWFAGRLRGRRAGLSSLAFYGASQSALYDGPRAADEWKVSSGSTAVNRAGLDLFGGGNVFVRPAIQVAPQPAPVRPAAPHVRAVEPEAKAVVKKELTSQELVLQLKVEIVSLGEKVSPVVKQALEKRLKEAEEAAARAPAPAAPLVAAAVGRKTFTEAEVTRLAEAAEKSATVADFLKTELVITALAEKQTSRATLDRWFAEFEQPVNWQGDAVKTARFKAMVRAEADLLGRRLLGRAAAFVELPPEVAEAQARGNAAANVLADARARVLDALRLNNPNLAAAMGAEGALAGRAAAATTNSAWAFRDGAYYSTAVGTFGRECQLPTKARIEFDMAWKGQPYFRFSFFTRSTEHYDFSDGWQFYTSSSGYIYSMRRSGMGATSSTGARVPQMLNKSNVRLTFLVNTETEVTTLLADGEKVHEWKNMGSPGVGTGVVFYNYNASSRVRISDIRIAPWDGRMEREREPLGAPGADPDKFVEVPPPDSAVVEFVNQDRATGTLHGIRDGKLAFNPAGTRLEIPLTRAALIAFPVNDAPILPKVEGVQVTLHRNERLTLALETWGAGQVIAVSPVFGRLTLKPESIRQLRFNPSASRGPVDEWGGP